MEILKEIEKYKLHPIYNSKNYTKFVDLLKIMSNSRTDMFFKQLFTLINEKYNIYKKLNLHKIFLTSFVIKYFPDEIFHKNTHFEKKLIEQSNIIIELFNNIVDLSDLNKFVKKLQVYIAVFLFWKNNDKNKLNKILIKSKNNLIRTKIFLESKELNDDDKKWLNSINLNIKIIDKELELLSGMSCNVKKINIFDKKQMLKIAQNAFWDLFEKNLSKTPPDYYQIYSSLNNIIKRINNLTPHRKDLQTELINFIDIDIIKRLIESNNFTIKYFLKLINFIYFKRLLFLCSSDMDNDITSFYNNYVKNINGKEWSYIIPTIFKDIYKRLDNIYDRTQKYYNALNTKSCPNCNNDIIIDSIINNNMFVIPQCLKCGFKLFKN